jgi:hypothetical protein
LAHFVSGLISRVNILHVVAESYSTKDESEDHTHKADVGKLLDVNGNSFEDISDLRIVAENIHDVQEEKGGMDERSEKCNSDVHGHSIELCAGIEWLTSVSSFQYFVNQLESDIDLQFSCNLLCRFNHK